MADPARGTARNLDRDTLLAERLETAGSLWAKFMGLMGRPTCPPARASGCRPATGST